MVFVWSSGGRRRRRRRGGGGGGGCLRDVFLLEGGCCLAEALTGNCLMLSVALLPQLTGALFTPGAHHPRVDGVTDPGRVGQRVISAIRVYQQRISPRVVGHCRFEPTCSTYAVQAITTHGASRGLRLTVGRLVRCRPGGRHGPDPVPPAVQGSNPTAYDHPVRVPVNPSDAAAGS